MAKPDSEGRYLMEIQYLEEFKAYLENQRGLAKSTIKAYTYDLGYYYEWMGVAKLKMEEVGPKDLDGYVRYMREKKKLEAKTCKRRIASISTYYKWMVREKLVKTDPVYYIELPKAPQRLPVYLGEEEAEKFYEMLDSEARERPIIGVRNKALFMLMVNGGLRISEAVSMVESQITMKDGYPVTVNVIGKGDKERQIPLNSECGEAILAWMETKKALREDDDLARKVTRKGRKELESKFLFPGRGGGGLNESTVQIKMQAIRKKIFGEKKITPHKLRHTFGTRLFQNKVDLRTVQELLGHASLATTQIYTHVEDEQKRDAVMGLRRKATGAEVGLGRKKS